MLKSKSISDTIILKSLSIINSTGFFKLHRCPILRKNSTMSIWKIS